MKAARWGDVCRLHYGKALRNYPAEPSDSEFVRVYGTNGPVGWTTQPLSPQPGIIVGRKGAYRGVHFCAEPFFVIDTAYYVELTSKEVDLRWAYYKLLTVDINRMDVGAAIPTTNRDEFYALQLIYPALRIQTKIADILSAYDDLMENNRRRMALLEEAARQLYREWFVRLRFPGREHTRITNGLPEGWERKRLEELAELKGGKQLENDKISSEGVFPVFGGNGVQGYAQEKTHDGFVIVFGRVGANCGSIHWSYEGAWINNNASSVVPHSHPELLLHHLLNFDFSNLRKGAAQPFIPNGVLGSINLWSPPNRLKDAFCEAVRPMRLQQGALSKINQRLRAARDLLLPRLMSGVIAV